LTAVLVVVVCEGMYMHVLEARNQELATRVDNLGVWRNSHSPCPADSRDTVAFDGHVRPGGRARRVNNGDVHENERALWRSYRCLRRQ